MKRLLLSVFIALVSLTLWGQGRLVYIPTDSFEEVQAFFEREDLTIHHYKDDFVVATLKGDLAIKNMVVVDENAFQENDIYSLVYCPNEKRNAYPAQMSQRGELLYDAGSFFIMKQFKGKELLDPAKNDGMIVIGNRPARLPERTFDFPSIEEIDPDIQALLDKISIDSIMLYVQHMEDYGTRRYDAPQAVEAANWIKDKYESWGLEANIEDFTEYSWWYGNINSSNVIAIQLGTEKPDEFIVCGGHFDSVNWNDGIAAPGADDNATGTAGVMEIARIFSQYEFERSIIYCAFGAEEIGLCGSAAYAEKCRQENKNILGYFNIDMSGYLKPGLETLISIIHPSSAAPLADFYVDVLETYFEGTQYERLAGLSGGDSDHTSFNQNGYLGIYPFENENAYCPYIHSSQDYIGKAVNSEEQVLLYTQITAASIGELGLLNGETIVPEPEFSIDGATEIMTGDVVNFFDKSENNPTVWYWYFEGGEPETSQMKNPAVTYLTEGVFDVKLVAENSAGRDSILKEDYITVTKKILAPIANFKPDKQIIQQKESVTFFDLSENEPEKWEWSFEGGDPAVSEEQNPTVYYEDPGEFKVKLVVSNEGGSDEMEMMYEVLICVGIDDYQISTLKIAPNPVAGNSFLKIESEVKILSAALFNLSGKLLHSYKIGSKSTDLLIPSLPKGMYLLRLDTDLGRQTIKIQIY
ncbi:M20/M25/M40 family metallo-hydrolase [Bacteroidales bacterium OttesenSCG-928-J16]|nr:M20/M25/M40 family metallo-hydrolase [Bacteroidales bacterium OttesenSCG-928-J16]